MRESHKGRFHPKNPHKYMGSVDKIVFRSSWEVKCMSYFDGKESIVRWSSEEVTVPYWWDVDKKFHKYFPDFIIQIKSSSGELRTMMIEVKPFKETQEPKPKQGKKKETLIQECLTYSKNQAKWKAARTYCEKLGIEFAILTEKDIFGN